MLWVDKGVVLVGVRLLVFVCFMFDGNELMKILCGFGGGWKLLFIDCLFIIEWFDGGFEVDI